MQRNSFIAAPTRDPQRVALVATVGQGWSPQGTTTCSGEDERRSTSDQVERDDAERQQKLTPSFHVAMSLCRYELDDYSPSCT